MAFYQLFHLILHEIDRFGCFMLESGFFSKILVLCLRGAFIGRVIFPINKMCGASFEGHCLFLCLFACFFFFSKGVVSSVWCISTLKIINHLISQNTVINDKMTSIDKKTVYETLSTGIFFNCCCTSEPEVSEQGSSPYPHRDRNFQFLPTMHLDFSYHNEADFLPQVLAHPLPLHTELRSMGLLVA